MKWTKINRPRYSIVLANESCVSFFSPNIIADLIKIFRCSFDGKIASNKKLSIYYIVLYSHCLRLKSKYWRAQCAPCWRTSHLSINNGSLRLNLLCAWKILTKRKKNHSETDFLADAEKPKLITISSKLNFLLGQCVMSSHKVTHTKTKNPIHWTKKIKKKYIELKMFQ